MTTDSHEQCAQNTSMTVHALQAQAIDAWWVITLMQTLRLTLTLQKASAWFDESNDRLGRQNSDRANSNEKTPVP
jgi:hypothetical protein